MQDTACAYQVLLDARHVVQVGRIFGFDRERLLKQLLRLLGLALGWLMGETTGGVALEERE